MAKGLDTTPGKVVAAFEHLTGPSRGTITWLDETAMEISISPEQAVQAAKARAGEAQGELIARLHRAENTYRVEASDGLPLWVNGKPVSAMALQDGDIIEFGEAGPLSRFRVYKEGGPSHKVVSDILCDCIDYMRASRLPFGSRLFRACNETLRQLTFETTILFRLAVISAIIVFAALAYHQNRLNTRLQQNLESGIARLEGFAAALARTRSEALQANELVTLREEVSQRFSSNVKRLEALENRMGASRRVITDAASSVAFLQGSYGYRERSTGRMLRQVVDDKGLPVISPKGQPLLSLENGGPVAEVQFVGTGFLVRKSGMLVTNRHVALPWEGNIGAGTFAAMNLEPVMVNFVVYFPGIADAIPVELLSASDQADLAILKYEAETVPEGLRLAETAPAIGDEVIVMGYPTGLRSMLAQSGPDFIEELAKTKNTDFWAVAARLAEGGHIAPLASRGIIGQVTPSVIVYDAETTHGGSGGPVLDTNGNVVAVNAAILPEYGGSNFGVPVANVLALLDRTGLN